MRALIGYLAAAVVLVIAALIGAIASLFRAHLEANDGSSDE